MIETTRSEIGRAHPGRRRSVPPPSAAAVLLVALVVVGALSSWGCTGGGAPGLEVPEEVDRVVLVTVDTLRADHMGAFGYVRDTTPFLDDLAARGALFRRAYAQTATTVPSHSSMFTGLYPIQHRVLNNGHMLAEEYRTLAEELRERGFRTAAFVGTNAHFQWAGISQGFEEYDEQPMEGRAAEVRRLYRPADETVDRALSWLEGVGEEERFFLWVHVYDPHRPLRPPSRFVREVQSVDDRETGRVVEFLRTRHHLDVEPRSQLLRQILEYDAEIRFVDAQVERLYRAVSGRGPSGATLWLVTSDHGQGLGNHGWFGHAKFLYNEQLHVPILLHFAPDGGEREALSVEGPVVEHVDLTPTILEIVGADPIEQPVPVSGRSLLPLIRGRTGEYSKTHAFAQRSTYGPERSGRPNYEAGERFAIQDLRYKYILFTEGPDEMYDLRSDPYETRNLVGSGSAPENRYRERLLGMIQRLTNEAPPEIVDDATLERLRALGYIQ